MIVAGTADAEAGLVEAATATRTRTSQSNGLDLLDAERGTHR